MTSSTQYSLKAKLLPVDFMFLKKQLGIGRGQCKIWFRTNKLSKNVGPYALAIRVKNQFFNLWKTVGRIPKEIFRHVYYFIKTKGGSGFVQLYQLNIVHHLFRLVDWKFHCSLKIFVPGAEDVCKTEKLSWFSLWLRLQWS